MLLIMKRDLLLILLLLSCMIAMSQTTWTGLGATTNWNNTDNWDTNLVPTVADDVVIPTGFTVTLNVIGSVKSIDVQGNAIFEMNTNLNYFENSSFGPNTTINWTSGIIEGNGSTLTNNGVINLFTGNVTVGSSSILTNNGTIKFNGGGDVFISTNGVVNNTVSGVIDFEGDDSGFSGSGVVPRILNNEGLIKTSFSDVTDKTSINVELINNGGTLQVEMGTLNLTSIGTELIGGVYNVFSGAALDWDSTVSISGTLSGVVDGEINWRSTVNVFTSAVLEFTGNETINWPSGNLSGEGTLTNEGTIEIQAGNVTISILTTLINNGTINFAGSGDIFIATNAILNNTTTGIIDFQIDDSGFSGSGAVPRILNNDGLIKTTFSDVTDKASIGIELHNNNGIIQVENGTLNLTSNGIELTDGTYNVFSGAALDLDSIVLLSGTLTGLVDGEFNWRSTVNILDSATFDFTGNSTIRWASGILSGGGILTNESTIEIQASNVTIGSDTTLDNNGNINFAAGGDIFISTDAVLNNTSTGIIDLQGDDSGFSGSGAIPRILNNEGILKATFSDITDKSSIGVELINNGGTIQVENGTLNFTSAGIELNDGTYNVFPDGTLDWDAVVTVSGTLSGVLDGILNWRSNVVIAPADSTIFNFSGNETVSWASGTLTGGGTLINESNIAVQANNVILATNTTLNNIGNINFEGGGDLFISTNAILNNAVTGEILFIGDDSGFSGSGAVPRILNNAGVIRTAFANDIVTDKTNIGVEVTNTGTIEAATGNLSFSSTLDHQVGGVIKGIATFDLPSIANFTNNGIFAPGASPGTLTVIGNYMSTASTILDVELDGLLPSTEYDVLAISGTNVVFEGSVAITMGFEANENDTFDIATTTGTISTQNLVSPIIVDYDGKQYTFEVSYPNNDTVRLTIIDKLDILAPDVITQNLTLQLDATGNVSILPTDVDNGSTDNCTPTNELQFALDISDFTCADLGDNTVMLTVTDNDNNQATLPATITVEDSMLPIVITQDITVQLDASGNASILPDDVNDGSSDNCMMGTLSLDVTDFTCADLGSNTVNLTVTDQSGNSDFASATVTVEDNSIPSIVCPLGFTIENAGEFTLPDYFGNGTVTGSDNCTVESVVQTPSPGTVLPDGDYLIEFLITDDSGNTNSCAFDLKVEDTTLSVNTFELSENDILLFPNPASHSITLKNASRLNLDNVQIIDVTGKLIKTMKLNDMELTQDILIEELANGVYFIRVNAINNSTITKRLIKQ